MPSPTTHYQPTEIATETSAPATVVAVRPPSPPSPLPWTHPAVVPRLAKVALVAATAVFVTLVVFNNLTDYDSNYQFVLHVMNMSTTFPGNHGMWRAINVPWLHHLTYASIILWEAATAVLCWFGAWRLLGAARGSAAGFFAAKSAAVAGLSLSLLQWLIAFLTVGGEWFLMWQSQTWNGQTAAGRMFDAVGIVLLFLVLPDAEPTPTQP